MMTYSMIQCKQKSIMKGLMINGSGGKIEARYHNAGKSAPVVMVFHGHPQNRGSMDHPVIQLACRTFVSLGFNVFTMNFRGVGRSGGEFTHGDQEVVDGAICLDWLRSQGHESKECWVLGLSFGGWVALQLLMRRPDCSRFVVLSLPIGTYDFNFLAPCPRSGLIINGSNDPMILPESILRFRRHVMRQSNILVDFEQIASADHSFQGASPEEELVIRKALDDKLRAYVNHHLVLSNHGILEEKSSYSPVILDNEVRKAS
jgi:uncharacterized protein